MILFIMMDCKLEGSHCHSVCTLWPHMRNYTKSVAVSGPWIGPSLGFAGPVHQFLPQFHSSLLLTGNTQVAVILYIQSAGPCIPLRVVSVMSVFCLHILYNLQQQIKSAAAASTAAAISSSSWKCQKPAAKQLLGTAGGTVRYDKRHGPPITVKIITPLLQLGRAGRHDGTILYGLQPRQKRRR
jgi:hypothetical protein